LRDLRYHKLIHNVTKSTDRRLWRAAIAQREKGELDEASVRWNGISASGGRTGSDRETAATTWSIAVMAIPASSSVSVNRGWTAAGRRCCQ
jgi:hypothetical protein